MKKLYLVSAALFFFFNSFASNILVPKPNAGEIYFPIGNSGKRISLMELSKVRLEELQTLTSRKMNFAEKISFRLSQRKLRNSINADGTFKNRKFEKQFAKRGGETGFHLGGFALGFLLGLIGVLIAYLIHDDYKKNRVKWAWIGLGIGIVLGVIIAVAV